MKIKSFTITNCFNTKNFGVPQNRERVYTVGHLRSRGQKQIFPLKGTDGEDSVPVKIIGHRDGYRRNTQVFAPEGVTEALSTCQGGGREHHVAVPVLCSINKGIRCKTETAPTLLGRDYKGLANRNEKACIAIPVLTPDRIEKRQNGRRFKDNGDESFTLTAQDRHGVAVEVKALGGLYTQDSPDHHRGILKDTARCLKTNQHDSAVALKVDVKALGVIDRQGRLDKQVEIKNISPTLRAQTHGNPPEVCLPIKEATKQGYAIAHEGGSINLSIPGSKTRRGRVGNGIANTLDCKCEQGVFVKLSDDLTVYAVWYEKYQCYIAIRKLTPRECFRLQGWTDDYFEKAAFVNSDSQLYKQAGNGVTVDVVAEIARQLSLFEEAENEEP